MISQRAVAVVVLAALIVGCASPATPSSSLERSAGPTASIGPPATTMPSAVPTSSPAPTGPVDFHEGLLAAGTYVMAPFMGPDQMTMCMPGTRGCIEDPADDTIRVTITVPAGFEAPRRWLMWGPDDTGLMILRGGHLYSDPCHSTPPPDIAVGPSVEDFATALADHPLLEATVPTDVSLAGFSGKYIDLQLPADVSGCTNGEFYPWEPGIYSQGPSHRWHLWILDVNGVRVVVQSMDYAHVSPGRRAELQAIVDSIEIAP